MAEPLWLGLDVGTSAVKALVADSDGCVVADGSAPLTTASPQPGWSEQDPEDWWAALLLAVARARDVAGDRWRDIAGIGLSGQMHGAVLLDADRAVLAPVMLWNDTRAVAESDALNAAVPAIADIAGVAALPGFAAPKLLWIARERPALHARIRHALMPKDWIGMRLHGQMLCDPSDAAGTHLFDQGARGWHAGLCKAAQVDPGWLPVVRAGDAVAGGLLEDAARHLGLRVGLPVAVGAGDTVAGAVGVGVVQAGRAVMSLGTSGQVFLCDDRHAPRAKGHVHAYAHTLDGVWFRMAAMLNGARPLAWYAGATAQSVPDLLTAAGRAELTRVPLFLPYLTGERTPHGDSAIRAGFLGLADGASGAEMARAVVDGIAYSFADGAQALGGLDGLSPLVTGGGAQSDLVLQTLADVLGVPIRRPEGAALGPAAGAARLASVAAGAVAPTRLADEPPVARVFTPDASQATRHQARLGSFRELYRAIAPLGGF
ncbi:MAG: xylulokinase [Rhodobacteraceae bacterium]|nr:xylulokinase [Paracoccaceae bacterium]